MNGISGLPTSVLYFIAMAATPAAPATTLQSSQPWKIDYADHSCVLSRPFSSAEQTYEFALTFEPIERRAWLRIFSWDKIKRRDDGDANVEVDGVSLDQRVHFNVIPDGKGGVLRELLFEDFRKDAGQAQQTLRLRLRQYGDLMLNLSDFPKAMRAMDTCLADLYRSLGIDPAMLKSVAIKPQGYSFDFVERPAFGDEGLHYILLYWVREDGRVEHCRLLTPSGFKLFDEKICPNLEKKGRFIPAKDAAGRPIRAPAYENVLIRRTRI